MTSDVELLNQRVPHRAGALSAASMMMTTTQTNKSNGSVVVMATAGTDARINVFVADDSASGSNVQVCLKDSVNVTCIALGPKAMHVLVGCADGTALLADASNGSILTNVDVARSNESDAVQCVDFYPYGEIFATGTTSGKVRLWDSTDSSAPMNSYRAPNDGAVTVVRFTPGGEWLLIGHASGTVALWGLTDAARAISPAPIKLHDAAIACIAFHPSDALVATADVAGTVRLFELRPCDGSLTAIGSAIDCQCGSPIKALCFVGSSTLVAAADGHVVSLQIVESPPLASLSVSSRIAAPALTGVHDMIADVDASHVIVSSQTQRPGGVCVWRVRLAGGPPTEQKPAAATLTSDENVPTNNKPQAAPVVTPPAPVIAAKKVVSARNKKTTTVAMTRTSSARTPPAVPVVVAQKVATPVLAAAPAPAAAVAQPVSEERRVLDELLQGHKQTRATIEARSRKFDSARLVLQQSGSRLSDALKAVHGGASDVGHAVSTAEQMAKRAQESADKFEYGPALALADGAMALVGEVLSSWNVDEWQVCTALSLVAQLAKWCDVSAGSEHDAMASSCRSRFSAVMRVLRCENALTFQLTARTRELRHECLKFEKYY